MKQEVIQQPIRTTTNSFSILNANIPPVLILHNLVSGTSSTNVKVVCASIGRVSQCKTLVQRDGIVTAEVLFQEAELAVQACEKFDGANADGHIIDAEIRRISIAPPLQSVTGTINNYISQSTKLVSSEMIVVRQGRPIIRQ